MSRGESTRSKTQPGDRKGDTTRAERLRAALRVNLKRRKSQARGRSQSGPGTEPVSARDSAAIVQDKAKDKAQD